MKIVSLLENLSSVPGLKAKHGLSLYIESGRHKLLFDLGPDGSSVDNAKKLGIDLSAVDTVIISHGHYDHGGGLEAFLQENHTAKIYMRVDAFEPHYAKLLFFRKYIGLDQSLADSDRLVLTGKHCVIDKGIELFSGVTDRKLFSAANKPLCKMIGSHLESDDFSHEQYLVVSEGEKQLLITGCSHNGIVNILEKFNKQFRSSEACTVIGGFHLFDPTKKRYEKQSNISAIADCLAETGFQFYTCHCTGIKAYKQMRGKMDSKLGYLATGKELTIV